VVSLCEKLLTNLMNVLKKFMGEDVTNILCLEVIGVFLVFETFETQFLNGGAAKLIANRLDEESTTKEFGILIMKTFTQLAAKSKSNASLLA
jgi:hypothetical protein